MGKLLSTIGNTAQCIAHATDVPIPKASQFNFNFIVGYKNSTFATMWQVLVIEFMLKNLPLKFYLIR
jgi:hypothetical protein